MVLAESELLGGRADGDHIVLVEDSEPDPGVGSPP
jgi:hypothetical protein